MNEVKVPNEEKLYQKGLWVGLGRRLDFRPAYNAL